MTALKSPKTPKKEVPLTSLPKPDLSPRSSKAPKPSSSSKHPRETQEKKKTGKARVLYWHRTDLRLTDSPALCKALEIEGIESFWPIWCFDPEYVYKHRVGLNRWNFLLESMEDVSQEYKSLNEHQKLWVFRGRPELIFRKLIKDWKVTHIAWEKDSNAYSKVRDEKIIALANELGVEVVATPGRHLYDPDEVIKANKGKPTMTLHQWQGITSKMKGIDQPYPTPASLPDPGPSDLEDHHEEQWGKYEGIDLNADVRTGKDTCFDSLTGPSDNPFSVPTMDQLGFQPATTTIHGGTNEGHRRLDLFLSDPEKVSTFSKPHTAPTALEPSTTLLSPYIKFGCIGLRELWWGCKDVVEKWRKNGGKGETKEPENMFGQLEFRDMYACAEAAVPHFERIRGNSVCKYVAWALQNQYDDNGNEILPRPRDEDEEAEKRFEAWREGRTGFPWIDACMRQLKHEGWIHHLARHSVACFLTRGQCYISWERGMEVFDEWLIDWDPASNPGNWMWLSASAFYSQYFRVYGLVSWPQKTDKTGALVRKYCPELKDFPDKYIYAPHLAPAAVQEKANCIIGKDYPSPILDEHVEKDLCIARLKDAYHLNYHGNDEDVLNGTAEKKLKELHEANGHTHTQKAEEDEKKRKRSGEGALDKFIKREKK
ncbi:uncharacterized protein I303_100428 [Kwoniella dejecticola CBS 10117]|uniref:Photolyase/cryptochrome alpha/beta domain-containing protein n=1 Tax=Kwoniella dejecticola CBS 10117 TaxID=1296121 RepID=A0A1A6AEW2_9TREE|nr:uncharacterized protein I303_00427 [Kwoniella dejecticola CBS 10117]OBR88610.1 hypothetical protein I303_00427 [Kwoniella dejecticola CBS 10117]